MRKIVLSIIALSFTSCTSFQSLGNKAGTATNRSAASSEGFSTNLSSRRKLALLPASENYCAVEAADCVKLYGGTYEITIPDEKDDNIRFSLELASEGYCAVEAADCLEIYGKYFEVSPINVQLSDRRELALLPASENYCAVEAADCVKLYGGTYEITIPDEKDKNIRYILELASENYCAVEAADCLKIYEKYFEVSKITKILNILVHKTKT